MELKHWERQKGELNQLIMCPTDEMRLYYNYRHTLDVGLSIAFILLCAGRLMSFYFYIYILRATPTEKRRAGGPRSLSSLSL